MGVAPNAGRQALPVGAVGSWGELTLEETERRESSVPAAFAEIAARFSAYNALEGPDGAVTFEELDRRSNQVAIGVLEATGPGEPVGLLFTDGVGFIVASLGALKAGRISLALDPRAPAPALAATLAAARASLVIADAAAEQQVPVSLRRIDDFGRESDAAIAVEIRPGDGAILGFTSGSTGEPRGHLRSHRGVLHHSWHHASEGIRPGARVALLSSPAFLRTAAIRVLLQGATLLRYDTAGRGAAGIGAWLTEKEIEFTNVRPSMIDPLLSGLNGAGLPTVRLMGIGGEKVGRARAELLRQALPEGALLRHSYASTEGSGICAQTFSDPIAVDDSPLPVGLSYPGVSVCLEDEGGAPAERGTIVVEGSYLSWPWNPDEPREPDVATRVIRTGDYGAIDDDGRLSILGRVDRTVKVRGMRVELDAVERALLALPSVRAAAAVTEASPRGTHRLVAYVGLVEASSANAAELRRELDGRVPPQMVPTRIVTLESLPLLLSGKVDLQAIAETAPDGSAPPQTETEDQLARIWQEVLEVTRVGRDDEFLDLGGDSLSAALVTSEVYKALDVELTPRILEETPTIALMAAAIEGLREAPARRRPPLPRSSQPGPYPLGIGQEVYWRDSLQPGYEAYYNLATRIELRGALDAGAFERAVEEIVRRHHIFRSSFQIGEKRTIQVVRPMPFFEWETIDLRDEPDPAAAAVGIFAREELHPFDVERDALIRFRLLRTGDDTHELVRVASHVAADAGTWRIFFRDLAALYPAYLEGRASPLPELGLQFGDYCRWQRTNVRRRSRFFWQELRWWREQLTPAPTPVRLPFARPSRVDDAPISDSVLSWPLPKELSERLNDLERDSGASYFVARLAALSAHLMETTGSRDLLIGVQVTARLIPGLEGVAGPMPNLMPVRLRPVGTPTLREWAAAVRRRLAEVSEHTDVSYAAMPWAFRYVPIGVPTIDVMAGGNRNGPPWERLPLPGLELRRIDSAGPPPAMHRKFDLSFHGSDDPERCNMKLDARKYDPALVREFLNGFARRTVELCDRPDAPLFRR